MTNPVVSEGSGKLSKVSNEQKSKPGQGKQPKSPSKSRGSKKVSKSASPTVATTVTPSAPETGVVTPNPNVSTSTDTSAESVTQHAAKQATSHYSSSNQDQNPSESIKNSEDQNDDIIIPFPPMKDWDIPGDYLWKYFHNCFNNHNEESFKAFLSTELSIETRTEFMLITILPPGQLLSMIKSKPLNRVRATMVNLTVIACYLKYKPVPPSLAYSYVDFYLFRGNQIDKIDDMYTALIPLRSHSKNLKKTPRKSSAHSKHSVSSVPSGESSQDYDFDLDSTYSSVSNTSSKTSCQSRSKKVARPDPPPHYSVVSPALLQVDPRPPKQTKYGFRTQLFADEDAYVPTPPMPTDFVSSTKNSKRSSTHSRTSEHETQSVHSRVSSSSTQRHHNDGEDEEMDEAEEEAYAQMDAMYEPDIPYKPHPNQSVASHSKKTKVITRSKLNDKVYWDGLRQSFNKFEKLVDGHLLQVGAGYIADSTFLSTYLKEGRAYVETERFFDLHDVHIKQAQWDRRYMYGILKSTTRGFEEKTTNEYQSSQDGFAVWALLKEQYANEGSKDQRIDSLEAEAQTPFVPHAGKKVVDYIDHFECVVTQLSTLSPQDWNETRKKKLLRSNLLPIGVQIAHLLQHVKDNPSFLFHDMVEYLLEALFDYDDKQSKPSLKTLNHTFANLDLHSKDSGGDDSSMHSMHSTNIPPPVEYLTQEAVAQLVTNLTKEIGLVKAHYTLQSNTMRESLRIPPLIWTKLEPMMRQKIDAIRQEVREEQEKKNPPSQSWKERTVGQDKPKSTGSTPKDTESIPLQYPTKAAHSKMEETQEAEDVFAGMLRQMHIDSATEEYDMDDDYVTNRLYHTGIVPAEDEMVVLMVVSKSEPIWSMLTIFRHHNASMQSQTVEPTHV